MECDKEKGNIPTKKTKECKYKKLLSYNDLVLTSILITFDSNFILQNYALFVTAMMENGSME